MGENILLRAGKRLELQKRLCCSENIRVLYKYFGFKYFGFFDPARQINSFFTKDHKHLIVYSIKYIQIISSDTFKLLHELTFDEEIVSVCGSNSELYIGYRFGAIEVIEIENCRKKQYAVVPFSNMQEITLSPLGRFIMLEYETSNEEKRFALYETISLTYISTFYGNYFLFNFTDEEIMVGYNRGYKTTKESKMLERWKIDKHANSNLYDIKKQNAEKWEHILKDFQKDMRMAVYISKWTYIPGTNKLAIYFRKEETYKLAIWNVSSWSCETIVRARHPINFFYKSNNFYSAEDYERAIKIRNLNTLEYDEKIYVNKSYMNMALKTIDEQEMLISGPDKIEILNLITKEKKTRLFLPGCNFYKSQFKNLHPLSDIDKDFLENLKTLGAVIE